MQPYWNQAPYTLISQWTMERFLAESFVNIGSQLTGLSGQMHRAPANCAVPAQSRLNLAGRLQSVVTTCDEIGLCVTSVLTKKLVSSLQNIEADLNGTQISQMLVDLGQTLTSEMETHLFLRIYQDRAVFYEHDELFGSTVNANFASAQRDIKAAGTCYAADRNTACVMHLMRVLELALDALADRLGVPPGQPNWENIINNIESEIAAKYVKGRPTGAKWKEERDFYSEAAKDFRYFKNAWRNHAMHVREHYDAPEARSILDHVKTFMIHLADNGLMEQPK